MTAGTNRTSIVQSPLLYPTLLAAHTASLGQYWHKLTDPTFKGIYHANFFDLAMMTVVAPFLIDWRWENGRLIKNVYPSTQADSPKKIWLAP